MYMYLEVDNNVVVSKELVDKDNVEDVLKVVIGKVCKEDCDRVVSNMLKKGNIDNGNWVLKGEEEIYVIVKIG